MATMKKALRTLFGRLSLVAGVDEISNFDFVKDIAEVVEYLNPKE